LLDKRKQLSFLKLKGCLAASIGSVFAVDFQQQFAPADVDDQHEHPRRAGNPLAQARLNRRGQRRIAQIDLEQAASAQCWVGQPRLAQRAVQVGQRIVQLRARALA